MYSNKSGGQSKTKIGSKGSVHLNNEQHFCYQFYYVTNIYLGVWKLELHSEFEYAPSHAAQLHA
jgi:hypothetical protein